ncbi:MAG: acyl-CoA thioesterase, partial [Chitinophagaceae bacterium]|nr:acyl-CoA thioesterase [Chitinophagaceae bacterium]
MNAYSKTFELRWSDVDANMHVMHSRYYELGAHCRMSFLYEHGITPELFKKELFGLILFREECTFRRELVAGEIVTVSFALTKARKNGSRFSVYHEIKKADGTVAAIMHADLAWMDLMKRKLTIPPSIVTAMIEDSPKVEGFVM